MHKIFSRDWEKREVLDWEKKVLEKPEVAQIDDKSVKVTRSQIFPQISTSSRGRSYKLADLIRFTVKSYFQETEKSMFRESIK